MKRLVIIFMCLLFVFTLSACSLDDLKSDLKDKVDDAKEELEDSDDDEDSEDEDEDEDEDETDEDEDDTDEDATEEELDDNSSYGSISEGDYTDFSTALSTFVGDYTTMKGTYSDIMSNDPDYENYIFDMLGFIMVDMVLIEVPMYDALDLGLDSGDKKAEGQLMWSGYDAVKEQDGDLIRFESSHTYDVDDSSYVTGDEVHYEGYLDTKQNALFLTYTVENGGDMITRTDIEILRSGDTFSYQCLSYDSRSGSEAGDAIYMVMSEELMDAVLATLEPSTNFEYSSLLDGDGSIETISAGSDAKLSFHVEDGDATFTAATE